MLWSGRFDADGNPTLTFRVSADDKTQGVEVAGIIDTGFTSLAEFIEDSPTVSCEQVIAALEQAMDALAARTHSA